MNRPDGENDGDEHDRPTLEIPEPVLNDLRRKSQPSIPVPRVGIRTDEDVHTAVTLPPPSSTWQDDGRCGSCGRTLEECHQFCIDCGTRRITKAPSDLRRDAVDGRYTHVASHGYVAEERLDPSPKSKTPRR